MTKKILIIGASGLVGFSLFEHFSRKYQVLGTYNNNKIEGLVHLNLLDDNELTSVLETAKPDVLLLPAALPNVELCEAERDKCWKYNVKGPLNVISLIKRTPIKLVYYSTDYIFDGKKGPYTEKDTPNPINIYGEAKLATEKNIMDYLSNYLILRTTVVYGWEHLGKNFVYRLIKNIKNGQTIKVPQDQVGTPTYVENIAEATLKLIGKDESGIFNVVGSKLMDRYEFALVAADVFHLDKSLIKPVLTPELNQKAARPLKAGLKIDKLERTIQVKMLAPREGLQNMKVNPKEYANID